ncbi:unnamed protein product [Cryptosporidium hominis]|uniref:Uncharacterized protein n=2 Tax=Cryptosporidium hominis TaxID=237895 RepID=A0A0S4TIX9_CRYHO|nr:unnamed protein product [Cryptosporidium hominis]
MHIGSKSRYIRIAGDKRSINKSQIKSIAINTLLSENSFLICGLNRKTCEHFLYNDKFAGIPLEGAEPEIDDYGMCLFEELVYNLFIQTKAIKQYYKQHRPNEIYFNKIKCSLILISGKSEDSDSEHIYDVFQGLNSPVEVILDNGVCNLNVLQVDVNDPVQIFNMINIARKLQFEKSIAEKEIYHKLFIFEIEYASYDKNTEDCYLFNSVYNKIYFLDYNYRIRESSMFIPSKQIKSEDIDNSVNSFFSDLTLTMAKTSHFLLEIVSNAIFDRNYSFIICAQCNGLNLFIDKCNIESSSLYNSAFSLRTKINEYNNCADENTLVSLIKKFHNYHSLLKNNFLTLKNEENVEKMSYHYSNLVTNFEDLKLVLFNLSGKIIKDEDLIFNIEHVGDLTRLLDNNDSLTRKIPIQFHIINRYLKNWYNESESTKEPAILSLRVYQDKHLDESNAMNKNFITGYENKLAQFISIEDSASMFNSNLELESELISCRNKKHSYNLNKSVIGISNEHLRVKNEKSNFYKLNGFGEKHTRSYLSIPNYLKYTKCSETPISKILSAVNTARRRVREYRHKQASKDLTSEFTQNVFDPLQTCPAKDIFWSKTLSKRPIFSHNKNTVQTETSNTYSVQEKIEIYAEAPDSKKDVEVQVDNINSEGKSECFSNICDETKKNNMNEETLRRESIETTENYQDKSQFSGLNAFNGGVGINSNLYKNSISYAPISCFNFNYQRPIIYQNTNSRLFPVQNIGIATFPGRTRNGNSYFFHRVK